MARSVDDFKANSQKSTLLPEASYSSELIALRQNMNTSVSENEKIVKNLSNKYRFNNFGNLKDLKSF
jgi:hypothetical protein